MPDDGFQITTSAASPHAMQATDDDALIRGLVAAWRSADAANSGLYDTARDQADMHAARAKTLLAAICSVRAETLAGALLQLDALAALDLVCDDQAEADDYTRNVHVSIGAVLMVESQTAPAA